MVNVGNIKINNVNKSFDEVKVLNNFSLNIEPGSFVSLIPSKTFTTVTSSVLRMLVILMV